MPMFCDTAPFDNVDVRNALKLSIDRDEIIEKITFGTATTGNDFHHSPDHALLARRHPAAQLRSRTRPSRC